MRLPVGANRGDAADPLALQVGDLCLGKDTHLFPPDS
jgi:hypothetical protein